jgi:hypothetical protein
LFAFLGSTTKHAFAILSHIIWESFWSGSALPSRLLLKEQHRRCCLIRLVEVVREGRRRLGGSSTSCEPSFLPSFSVFFVFVFLVFCHTLKHTIDLVIDLVYGWFLCRFSSLCCCYC